MTTPTTVTLDDIIAEVRRLASEKPDFVYQSSFCRYVEDSDDGKWCGSCIIGQALINTGVVTAERLREHEGTNAFALLHHVLYRGVSGKDVEAIGWLDAVQRRQDRRATWSQAVEIADRDYPGVRDGS